MMPALVAAEGAAHRPDSTEAPPAPSLPADDAELRRRFDEILNRRPAVGLAVGVIRGGRLETFLAHGLADIATRTPITADTVFRAGSLTKLFTAISVMQLRERGLVDLDAPAGRCLRAFRLVPASRAFRPATLRHLLTHTAGIPEVVRVADLLHPGWGPFEGRPAVFSVRAGEPMPTLAECYRRGLPVVAEPGSAFAYSNHGFAALGQIVEDVTGMPLDRCFRERLFEPLGMTSTDLVRSRPVAARLATGYVLGRRGASPVPDRDWVAAGSSGIYSTPRDMARFVAALLAGGANGHAPLLEPATLATMFAPHYRPDPRLPGMGLAFFPSEAGAHRLVGHDGIMPGFNSTLLLAPEDGIGVVAFTNGSSGAWSWLPTEVAGLLGHLLGVPDAPLRRDVPHHPEVWGELCGRYRLPGRVSDLRGRLVLGGGVEVFVRGGRLTARMLTPVPALYRGIPLQPDDEHDPYAFRVDLSALGIPAVRVVFSRGPGASMAMHTDLQSVSLYRHPDGGRTAARLAAGLGLAAGATVAARLARRSGSSP